LIATPVHPLDVAAAPELPVIEFVSSMLGFPDARRFVLVRLDDAGMLYALTSVEDDGLRFLVVPPDPFFSDYVPEIDEESLAALGAGDGADLLVLLVVTTGATARDSTVNLMAPIVLHEPSRRAVQLVLGGSGLPVRAALLPA
jgi:flagellar assembly factor FliW